MLIGHWTVTFDYFNGRSIFCFEILFIVFIFGILSVKCLFYYHYFEFLCGRVSFLESFSLILSLKSFFGAEFAKNRFRVYYKLVCFGWAFQSSC